MKQLTVAMITLLLTASCSEKQQDYPFRNPDLPLEERIDDLLSRLTPEEKIGQMVNVTPAIERLGIPTYDWWNEALHGVSPIMSPVLSLGTWAFRVWMGSRMTGPASGMAAL